MQTVCVDGGTPTFQSAPGFWAGRYNPMPRSGNVASVSIRSRLLGREILVGLVTASSQTFQSAPGFWAGRYLLMQQFGRHLHRFNPLPAFGPGDTAPFGCCLMCSMFQSAPGFWAGRYKCRPRHVSNCISFNPLPAFGPGDTFWNLIASRAIKVSIRSRLLGREILFSFAAVPNARQVSIRSRLLGREIQTTLSLSCA